MDRGALKGAFIGCGLVALLLGGCAGFNTAMDVMLGSPPATAAAKPKPTPEFIDWKLDHQRCADGWPSQSIGRQGACSHHGGVVSVWTSPGGYEAVCRNLPPLTMEMLERQLELYGRIVC